MNSGKPSETYIQNSFVIFVDDEETKERLFWLTYSLSRSKTFIPFLIGSVIPFIRLGDYKNIMKGKYDSIKNDVQNFDRTVNELRLIERKEKNSRRILD